MPEPSSYIAFGITVFVGFAGLSAARMMIPPAGALERASHVASNSADGGHGRDDAPEGEAEGEAVARPSMEELMAELTALMKGMRDAEKSGDGPALMAAVKAADGRLRAPDMIIEHSAYRAIALCRTKQLEEGQRRASIWLPGHGTDPMAFDSECRRCVVSPCMDLS